MADRIDENTPETEQGTAGHTPQPDPATAPTTDSQPTDSQATDSQPTDSQPTADVAPDTPVAPVDAETDEEADGETEATAAAALTGGPTPEAPPEAVVTEPTGDHADISHNDPFGSPTASRTAPARRDSPADEAATEGPRFAAPFSSPEPTTVTARPRRRATRPALSADPDSVAPAPAQVAPTLPAFVTFVAPSGADAAAPRRRGRRAQAGSPSEPAEGAADEAPPAEGRATESPAPRRGRRGKAAAAESPAESPAKSPAKPTARAGDEAPETAGPAPRRSRSRRRDAAEDAPDEETVAAPGTDDVRTAALDEVDTDEPDTDEPDTDEPDTEDGDDSGPTGSRRRRRGRRGRGRGRTGEDGADGEDEGTDASAEDATAVDARLATGTADEAAGEDDEESDDGDATGGSSTRRRRRRRRRGESGGGGSVEDVPEDADDRPERAGRNGRISSDDDVRGVAGSTRLEAKRQRRREGRDGGRKRAPILSESEFLARREAVDRAMVIRQQGERTQIAVLEDDVLVEHYVTQTQAASFAGNVYLGRVQNVLPSMEAAFVDVGKGRNAVLYAGEVNWDVAGLSGKSRSIEQALKSGDKVLVQVTKDPIGHKGARLTQQINLPGRFLVYVPGGSMTGISRKLPDKERTRLKDILKKIVPDDAGVIIRTAAEGASEEELTRDVARLQAQWEVISTRASSTSTAPTLLYGEPDLAIRVIRDVFNEDFKRLVVQGDDAWDTVEAYVAHVSPELSERVQRYTGTSDAFSDLRIDEQLMKALDRKVWLPSGGSLVIDRTEAMTVVDVNTGKFVGSGGNLEQTVTRNNIEAAEEIVRQLRLRDIGGMIVIDFIDMVLESNRDLVLRRLTECLGRDRTKHQVAEVTSLGLVQMTRKRVGQGLLEVFSEPCEHCRGRGVLVHLDPVEEKRRSSGNGGGNGSGNGGGNGGSVRSRDRDRDQQRSGRDDQPHVDADVESGATPEDVVDDSSAAVEEVPTEGGRNGRRSRGRRGRGQSGEARAAEDAAVLTGVLDPAGDEPAEDLQALAARNDAALPDAPDAVAEATIAEATVDQDAVADQPPAGTMQAPAEMPSAEETAADVPAEELPEPAARPRRRRGASRPAGPPA